MEITVAVSITAAFGLIFDERTRGTSHITRDLFSISIELKLTANRDTKHNQ